MKTNLTNNHAEILTVLERDRLFAAYAIGDLEPEFEELCTWALAKDQERISALVLHYRGLALPALFLMGEAAGMRAILERTLRPEHVYITCLAEHQATTAAFYIWQEIEPMWRMVLSERTFHPISGPCSRLSSSDLAALQALYAHGGADAFQTSQLENGVFYGAWRSGSLVAAAGTHLVSPTYRLAALGNVLTHPDWRGRGLGSVTTSAVVGDLLRQGMVDVVLNVARENMTAGRLYEKLGFQRYCPFVEGRASAWTVSTDY